MDDDEDGLSMKSDEQKEAEESERDRWVREACSILVQDQYPVTELATSGAQGWGFLRRVFGGRRGRTIRAPVAMLAQAILAQGCHIAQAQRQQGFYNFRSARNTLRFLQVAC